MLYIRSGLLKVTLPSFFKGALAIASISRTTLWTLQATNAYIRRMVGFTTKLLYILKV
jgi:hypothetical protein